MAGFNSKYFPKYAQLNVLERLFFRTCFYHPRKLRRERTLEDISEVWRFRNTYERAFGSELWKLIAGKQVLDLGCGGGGYALAMAKSGAGRVVGLDIRPTFSLAQEAAKKEGIANVEFVMGDIGLMVDGTFDVVISHDAFEHFEEPEKILAEMVRVAKPGGRILIKFGPTWRSPWGRHMSGSIRKDRPWIHLIVPERMVMRCRSVYGNDPVLKEWYSQREGGLNKMTVSRFKKILQQQGNIKQVRFREAYVSSRSSVKFFPFIVREFFIGGVMADYVKV